MWQFGKVAAWLACCTTSHTAHTHHQQNTSTTPAQHQHTTSVWGHIPPAQALASEIVALEERHRATRAAELRLGKEAAALRDSLEDARRQLGRARGVGGAVLMMSCGGVMGMCQ